MNIDLATQIKLSEMLMRDSIGAVSNLETRVSVCVCARY